MLNSFFGFRIMTNSETRKLQVTLCQCGSPFRGENFKKHICKCRSQGIAAGHGPSKRITFCAHCCVVIRTDEEKRAHVGCTHQFVSKRDLLGLFEGRLPAQRKRDEERESVEGQVPAERMDEERVKEAEEKVEEKAAIDWCVNEVGKDEDDFILAPKKKKQRVDLDASHSSAMSLDSVFNPEMSSTPEEKGIEEKEEKIPMPGIKKQQPWDPRAQAQEASQSYAKNVLIGQLEGMRKQRDEAVRRSSELEAKVAMIRKWERQVASLQAEVKERREKETELVEKVRRLEREKVEEVEAARAMARGEKEAAMATLRAEVEAERKVAESKIDIAEAKVARAEKKAEVAKAEAEDAKAAVKKKAEAKPEEWQMKMCHVACQGGRILDKRWEDVDGDETSMCFLNAERGIACHHLIARGTGHLKIGIRSSHTMGE